MKNKIFILLSAVVLLGALLRLAPIKNLPPGLNWDEISHGYNAYSILKTGADQWGQKFPIFDFRAYGDYPLTLNLYLTTPFVAIFGLTEFAIRFPHATLGALTIIATYFLMLGVTKDKYKSLLASFLVAIGPWYILTSRQVLQANLSIFLVIAAVTLFLYRTKNKYFLPLSLTLFFLSLFAYHSTRIFSPLFIILLILIYRKEFWSLLKIRNIITFKVSALLILFAVTLPIIFLRPETKARSQWVFLLDQGAINKIISQRDRSSLSPVVKRLIYNRPVYLAEHFTKNYFEYLSPYFLFINGGTQYQFSLPNYGLLHLVNLPFFYIGLFVLLKKALKNREKVYQLLLAWLLLSPIAASLTQEQFAVVRSTTMLPLPQILVALGFFYVFEKLHKHKVFMWSLAAAYILILLGSTELYMTKLATEYPKNYSWAWQYGYEGVANYINSHYNEYDKIIVTKKYGEPHEYLLFYLKWDPAKYQNDSNKIAFFQSDWFWVDRFDKFYFVNDWEIPKDTNLFILESRREEVNCVSFKCLLVTSPGNVSNGWKKINSINFLDGTTAFEIYEN